MPINKAVKALIGVDRRVTMVPIDEIDCRFYIRVKPVEDRILMFSEMIEAGEEINPILVTRETKTLIDGRTRLAAFDFCDCGEVPCYLCDEADDGILISAAYMANADPKSSKPPERADIRHTMELLLRAGTSRSDIKSLFLSTLGSSLYRRYLSDAESRIAKQKIANARKAVGDGRMTVHEAANHYGVELSALREAITGTGKGRASNGDWGNIKANMSNSSRRLSSVFAQYFEHNMQRFEAGEITAEDLALIMNHENRLARRILKGSEERLKRFRSRVEAE